MIARVRRMREMISLGTMMVQDAPARPGIGLAMVAAVLSFVVPALAAPHPALAQFQILDPSAMAQSTAQGWIGQAKSIANGIFGTLMVLEFTFFGIQFALFRDNLTDILGSMALKVVTTGFFLWLISQADTLFPAIINSFTKSANQMTGNGGAFSSLTQLSLEIFAACALIYGSATTAQLKQQFLSYVSGFFFYGSGFAGQANGAPVANTTNILLEQVIVFLLISSLAVILMQWVITNIESYIVMFGGIVFLGFSGSRWTMPFAQGYLSYAVNVGAKLFTLYLVLAIEANLGLNVLLPVGASAALIAVDPTGAAGPLNIAILFWASIQVAIMAAVAYAVPNLTGSFLSGQSSMSGAQALSTMTSSMASIRMANAAATAAGNAGGREAAIGAQQASMNAPSQAAHRGPDTSTSTGTPASLAPVGALVGAAVGASPNADAPPPASGSNTGQTGNLYGAASADAPSANGHSVPGGQNGTLFTATNGSSGHRVDPAPPRMSSPGVTSGAAPVPISAHTQPSSPTAAFIEAPTSGPAEEIVPSSGSPDNAAPPAMQGASVSAAPGAGAPASSTPGRAAPAAPAADASALSDPGFVAPTSGAIPVFAPPPMVGASPAQTANAMAQNALARQTANSGSGSSSSGQQGIDFNNLKAATPLQGRASVGRDPLERLSPDQWNQIPQATRDAMADEMKNQMAGLEAQREQSQAYAMQLLAQALPRDGAPPAAVQVRLSNPDKL